MVLATLFDLPESVWLVIAGIATMIVKDWLDRRRTREAAAMTKAHLQSQDAKLNEVASKVETVNIQTNGIQDKMVQAVKDAAAAQQSVAVKEAFAAGKASVQAPP